MKKALFLTFFLVIFYIIGMPQTQSVVFDFVFITLEEDSNKVLKNTPIEIYEDGKLLKKITTNEQGKAFYDLQVNKEYDIYFKPNRTRYIQKYIKIDTRNIDLANWKYKDRKDFRSNYQIEINLFRHESWQNFDFLKAEPIIHYKYDAKKGDLVDISDDTMLKRVKKERSKKRIGPTF